VHGCTNTVIAGSERAVSTSVPEGNTLGVRIDMESKSDRTNTAGAGRHARMPIRM